MPPVDTFSESVPLPSPAGAAAELVERLPGWHVSSVTEAGGGRGVFSTVWRVGVSTPEGPRSVIAKLPVEGPNGQAARASGAYEREAWAYRELLIDGVAPRHARCLLAVDDDDRGASFVLEDLGRLRRVDQAAGLGQADAHEVVRALAGLHSRFTGRSDLEGLPVRVTPPAGFAPEALAAGVTAVEHRCGRPRAMVFEALVARRREFVEAFVGGAPPTLCHGDPRADNLVFDDDGGAVLFDWQQVAIQIGEADVAWLCGTSLDPATRRRCEAALVDAYAVGRGLDPNESWERYRLGYLLPGLAVLFLAQREASDERTEMMIANSIDRIGTALTDLDVADVVR